MAPFMSRLAVGNLPPMPADASGPVFSYSEDYVQNFSVPAGGVGILAVAPFGFTLGYFQAAGIVGSSYTTAAAQFVQPPFTASAIIGASDNAARAIYARTAGLCVGIVNTTPLAGVSGLVAARRISGAINATTAGTALDVGFGNMVTAILAHSKAHTGSQLTQGHCVESLVNSSIATQFQEILASDFTSNANNQAAWLKTYVSPSSGDIYPTCPWMPTLVYFDNTAATVNMTLSVTYEVITQCLPYESNFLSTMDSNVPRGLASEYLKKAALLRGVTLHQRASKLDRDPGPYMGVTQGKKPAKAAPPSKPKSQAGRRPKQAPARRPNTRGRAPRREPKVYEVPSPPGKVRDELRRAAAQSLTNLATGMLTAMLARPKALRN